MRRERREWVYAFWAVIALGIVLRSLGFFDPTLSFWGDEGFWAAHFLEGMPWEQEKRPIAYAALIRLMVHFNDAEWVWRLPSYLGELAAFWIFYLVGRALKWRSLTMLFALLVVALNPNAIELAKEFKPYALELCLHLLLVYLALRAFVVDKGSPRHAHLALLLMPLCLPFAYNLVFLLPFIYGLAVTARWPTKQKKVERHWLISSGLVCANAALALALVVVPAVAENDKKYWAAKYQVFYVGNSGWEGIAWYLHRTVDVAAFGVMPKVFWPISDDIFYYAPVALCAAALVILFRRRQYRLAALLFGPWLTILVVSVFGHWPYAGFRTNIFMAAYATIAAGIAVDALCELPRGEWIALGFVSLWTLGALPLRPGFYLRKSAHSTRRLESGVRDSRMREVLQAIDTQMRASQASTNPRIVGDWWGTEALLFYGKHDRRFQRELLPQTLGAEVTGAGIDLNRVAEACAQVLHEPSQAPVWGVFTYTSPPEIEELLAKHGLRVLGCERFRPHVLCRLR